MRCYFPHLIQIWIHFFSFDLLLHVSVNTPFENPINVFCVFSIYLIFSNWDLLFILLLHIYIAEMEKLFLIHINLKTSSILKIIFRRRLTLIIDLFQILKRLLIIYSFLLTQYELLNSALSQIFCSWIYRNGNFEKIFVKIIFCNLLNLKSLER